MSGYGKAQPDDENDYDTSRPSNPLYLAYPPTLVQQQLQPSSTASDQHENQMRYAASIYQPRASYEESPTSFTQLGHRNLPEVTSCTPRRGPRGTQVLVNIRSTYELTTSPALNINLMFATRHCAPLLTRLERQGQYYHYALTAEAPPFSSTGGSSTQVPLQMHLQEESGLDAGFVQLGFFEYTDSLAQESDPSSQELSRKRKISMDSMDSSRQPTKRSSYQQLHSRRASQPYMTGQFQQGDEILYSQIPQPSSSIATPINFPYMGRSRSQQGYQMHDSGHRTTQSLSTSAPGSQSHMRVPSSQRASWSPSYTAATLGGRATENRATSSRTSAIPSSSGVANPPLIRTSTIPQQSPSPAATPGIGTGEGSFNPYAMYPFKAVLKINGDLDSMADHWSDDEWRAKRRLVQFTRSQTGSTITANFEPVTPEERLPNSICISCIWWEERNECFVTSVDTIYLLESLVAVRFTVEEKNRIRRNLEGFRPMTVSKAKPESEPFFKVIMSFTNPKPRNIEKDVKVFPWKILAHALKKIIGKYSASYSSTAGSLQPPGSSNYATGQGSLQSSPETGGHHPSSRSTSESAMCSAYNPSLLTTMLSPNRSHGTLTMPTHYTEPSAHYSEPPTLSISAPSLTHAFTVPSSQFEYQQQVQMTSQAGQVAMPPRTGSLDWTSFLDTTPTSADSGFPQLLQRSHE